MEQIGKPMLRAGIRRAPPLSWLEPAVITGGLVPLSVLFFRYKLGLLPDYVAETLNQLGLLSLVFLMSSLACTPLKMVLGWTWPLRIRKTLGLFGFFYALMHFSWYVAKDQEFKFVAMVENAFKNKFIMFGFMAFVLLIPLAVTSTNKMIARMGAKQWRRLHRLAYICGILAVIHFYLRVKLDITEPAIYGGILVVLLGVRLIFFSKQKAKAA